MTAVVEPLLSDELFAAPPHPAERCCDPDFDLPGWLAGARQLVDELVAESRRHSANAAHFHAAALRADVHTDDFALFDEAYRGASFAANHAREQAWDRFNRAEHVETAHQLRLSGRPRLFIQPDLMTVPRRCGRCETERCQHFPDGAGSRQALPEFPTTTRPEGER